MTITLSQMAKFSNGKKKNGWVLGKYLSEKKIKPKATAKPKPTVNPQIAIDAVMDTMRTVEAYPAEVTTKTENGTVALRMQPTTNGKLIYNIPNRHAITVLAEGDGWFQVRDDETGSTGFMSSKYIVAREEAEAEIRASYARAKGTPYEHHKVDLQ